MEFISLDPVSFTRKLTGLQAACDRVCVLDGSGRAVLVYLFRDGDRIWCMDALQTASGQKTEERARSLFEEVCASAAPAYCPD